MQATPKKKCQICGKMLTASYIKKHMRDQHGKLSRNSASLPSVPSVPEVSDELLLQLISQDSDEAETFMPSPPPKADPSSVKEQEVQRRLERKYRSFHKTCPAGIIDIFVSGQEIIEIKTWKDWKHALGQILAYSFFYPKLGKKIHFFGPHPDLKTKIIIMTVLTHYGIEIDWEKG